MKVLKYIFQFLVIFLLVIVILFSIFLIYATITDYNPEEQITLFESSTPDTLQIDQPLGIITWNIGYAGLGKNMDFFYDGGTRVRDTRSQTEENLHQIQNLLKQYDSIPLILLQEVDRKAKRTYKIDQVQYLSEALGYSHHFFAINYKSFFVPMPLLQPMGRVLSGLSTFSMFEPVRVDRYDFPGSYAWPTRIFMLDRCFLVARFILNNGKELLVINTHNSAFDGGDLKKEEMRYLKEFILKEYDQGHYILVGGDWNQNPPGYEDPFFNENSGYENFILNNIENNFPDRGWTWHFDRSFPTNRAMIAPYTDQTATTILDFFLASPNIVIEFCKTINLDFQNTDHQPVVVQFKLNQ